MKLPSLFALLLLFSTSIATAAELPQTRVTLDDGRTVVGEVDDATDATHLWVRLSEDRIRLAVSYPWDEVASLEVDGREVSADEVLASPDEFSEAWPEYFLFDEEYVSTGPPAGCPPPPARLPRAASTSFVATLANWDRDVEPDGYEIAVTVIDEYGQPMPVRGTLSAKLIGERTDRRGVPSEPVELERWSNRIDPAQFAGGPAIFRLPFRRIHPERELDIEPGGILQIEVGAFEHGRMTSSAAVPLRHFNPIRDRYEHSTGSRFFPGERHQRWSHP